MIFFPFNGQTFLLAIFLFLTLYFFYLFFIFWFSPLRSPLCLLPGPPSNHWYFGWTIPKILENNTKSIFDCHQKYGKVFYARQYNRKNVLYIIDEKAINFILNGKQTFFGSSPEALAITSLTFGKNTPIITSSGKIHKIERKVLQPSFMETSINTIGDLMFLITKRSIKTLQTRYNQKQDDQQFSQIDIVQFSRFLAIDIIGLAGFGCDLNALSDDESQPKEVQNAFMNLISNFQSPSLYFFFCLILPDWIRTILKPFIKEEKRLFEWQSQINQFSKDLIENFEKEENSNQDFQSVLSKMKKDCKNNIQNTTIDDSILKRMVPSIIIGGFETTSSNLSWAFYALTKDENGLEKQNKLRSELVNEQKNFDWQEDYKKLKRLEYLDAFCLELLRMYPVAILIPRICLEDTTIPLKDPIQLKNGQKLSEIKIAKDDRVYITPMAINRSVDFFGERANEFHPERWLKSDHQFYNPSLSLTTNQLHSWNHLMTFGQGERMCIGYKFALAELKITLAFLIANFEWRKVLNDNKGNPIEIQSKGHIFMKPTIKGSSKNTFVYPIKFKPFDHGQCM